VALCALEAFHQVALAAALRLFGQELVLQDGGDDAHGLLETDLPHFNSHVDGFSEGKTPRAFLFGIAYCKEKDGHKKPQPMAILQL
jgi:hypothetical protein